MTITVSALTGGSNNYQFTSQQANALATDFVTPGVVGSFTNTLGVAPATGAFAVNATGTPDTNVQVSAGNAWVTATPNTQSSQALRVVNTGTVTVAIPANVSGSTRFDWVYIKIDPTLANNPDASGTTVGTVTTSRSTSSTTDNGTPPTYGYLLAVVTVANSFTTITNANISDKRTQAAVTVVPTAFVDSTVNPSILLDSSERITDHVVSGTGIVALSAGLVGSFTNITYYISGKRFTLSSIANHTYTASQDTYVDISNTGTVTYQGVANNAAAPALGANSIRVAKVVTSGSAITSVLQSPTATTSSGQAFVGQAWDSLGNPIYPMQELKGKAYCTSATTSNANLATNITGMVLNVKLPYNAQIEMTGTFDIDSNGTTAAGTFTGGMLQSTPGNFTYNEQAIFINTSTVDRKTISQTWYQYIPANTLYTFQGQLQKLSGTGNIVAQNSHTSITYRIKPV